MTLWDNPDLTDQPPGELRFRGGHFSNFAVCRLRMAHPWTGVDTEYLTVEHRFQAYKAASADEHDYVNRAPTAREAKNRGREVKMRADWEGTLRVDVMREALRVKFAAPFFADALRRTGNLTLIEDAPWDPIWGCGPDGKGRNLLGKLLMDVRSELATLDAR